MEQLKKIECPKHKKGIINRICSQPLCLDPLCCIDCILDDQCIHLYHKDKIITIDSYIDNIVKECKENKFTLGEVNLPKNLKYNNTEIEAEILLIQDQIEKEKAKIEVVINQLLERLTKICKQIKENAFKTLDDQLENFKHNHQLCKNRIKRYYPNHKDEPPKPNSHAQLDIEPNNENKSNGVEGNKVEVGNKDEEDNKDEEGGKGEKDNKGEKGNKEEEGNKNKKSNKDEEGKKDQEDNKEESDNNDEVDNKGEEDGPKSDKNEHGNDEADSSKAKEEENQDEKILSSSKNSKNQDNYKFTKSSIIQKINAIKNIKELEAFINEIQLDLAYQVVDDVKKSEIVYKFNQYIKLIKHQSIIRPEFESIKSNFLLDDVSKTLMSLLMNQFKLAPTVTIPRLIDNIGVDSVILEPKQKKTIASWTNTNETFMVFKLIYRASHDGFSAKNFHKKVKNIKPTLVVALSEYGNRFGGYTEADWSGSNIYKYSPKAYLFDLTGNTDQKYIIKEDCKQRAIFCHNNYGPTFGEANDLFISDNSNQNRKSFSNAGFSYFLRKDENPYLGGEKNFRIKEFEVFQVI